MYKALFTLLIFTACGFSSGKHHLPPAGNYDAVKSSINTQRNHFKSKYDAASSDSAKKTVLLEAGNYLKASLLDSVFPHWYNTGWDFNGYTDKPREGKVACGYFVSTPLKHSGFNLNRFKLAQKYSTAIVKILSAGDSVRSYRDISAHDFIARSKKSLKDGLYVVGLDFHVGFLLYEKGEVFFIHSNYRDPVAVVREKALDSAALNDSKVFVLCNITGNEKLMKKWIMGTELVVQ
ncbi:MAG: hypothetical protein ACJ75J_09295 [Cytophagaceae bacterium]